MGLAGQQMHARKSIQRFHGRRHAGGGLAHIKLRDFITFTFASVPDLKSHGPVPVAGWWRGDCQTIVFESPVTQAETKNKLREIVAINSKP